MMLSSRFINTNINTKTKTKTNEDSDDDMDVEEDSELKIINNEIYFYGQINKESSLKLRTELRKMEIKHNIFAVSNSCSKVPIKLFLNSEGGEVACALSIVDSIKRSTIPIHTIIEGETASAATLISVVGHKRYMTKNAHMLIHQIRGGIWGKMQEFEEEMKNMKTYSSKLIKIYKEHSKLEESKLDKILKKDIVWNSTKCLKYGIVDEII